jgi:nitrate reductase NapAB chaperone NapD
MVPWKEKKSGCRFQKQNTSKAANENIIAMIPGCGVPIEPFENSGDLVMLLIGQATGDEVDEVFSVIQVTGVLLVVVVVAFGLSTNAPLNGFP